MHHFVASISPFSAKESHIHWSGSVGGQGDNIESLVAALGDVLKSGSATLGVSVFDEVEHEFSAQNAAKGFRLVQDGSAILGEVIAKLREVMDYRIYVGAEYFEDAPASLLLWQVKRDLAKPTVAFNSSEWAARAYQLVDDGVKGAKLSTLVDTSLPICIVSGALYRSNWVGELDFSENMVVLEV